MPFLGHLLKVNGVIIPSRYIDTKTYKATPDVQRVIDKYTDGNDVEHESLSPHKRSEISFSTNGMYLAGKNIFMSFFPTKADLTVEFYNHKTDNYQTGNFKRNDFEFGMFKIRSNDIIYQPISVMLEEY